MGDTDFLCTEKGFPEQPGPTEMRETILLRAEAPFEQNQPTLAMACLLSLSPQPFLSPHQLVLLLHLGDLLAVLLVHLFQLSYHSLTLLTQHLLVVNELGRVKKRHQTAR